jgi:hypothetical protein
MDAPPVARHPISFQRLQHRGAGADAVTVRKDLRLERGDLAIDVYEPASATDTPRPWVLLVNGLPDSGARRILGCAIKDMASYESWGRAIAASDMVAVAHATENDPASDLHRVWDALQAQADALGLARDRGALWACSSHVPNALGLLLDAARPIRAAVLCYGYMLDLDGAEGVAEAQRTWHFANPAAGHDVGDLAPVPMLVVRAGRDDTPHLNPSIDAFVRHALAGNVPLTLVNHPDGVHAFDLTDATPAGRLVVKQILDYLRQHLQAPEFDPVG